MAMKNSSPTEEKTIEYQDPQAPKATSSEETGTEETEIFTEESVSDSVLEQSGFPEALCSATITLLSKRGSNLLFTVRGTHPKEVLDKLANAVMYAEDKYGLSPATDYRNKAQAQVQKEEDAKPVKGETQYNGLPIIDSGVSEISQIVVMKDHAEFTVGKFAWPFKDFRKPDIVASIFDKELGFDVGHFSKPGVFLPDNWGDNIVAEWVKVQKGDKTYYNITRVRKA